MQARRPLMQNDVEVGRSSTEAFCFIYIYIYKCNISNSVALVRERTIPTERPPLAGEVVSTSADTGCRVVSVTDPYDRILGFLDRSCYCFSQIAPEL
jgi:hypothetical protein